MHKTRHGARHGARLGVSAAVFILLPISGTSAARAAIVTREHGIDFVTIGDPGNAAYEGEDLIGRVRGRGSVPYDYRIGKLEITTAQWMEFVNTFTVRGGSWTLFATPVFWGATPDPTYTGPGERWQLRGDPNAGQFPVGGISWREAAMYCNWLHNGQGAEEWTIRDGAYDTSTFFTRTDGTLADQGTHHPAARFWIPTLDEWIKAAHYDPDRMGPGEGGWWMYSNRSDSPPIPGIPGVGQTNAELELPDWAEWDIPLGSYPDTSTPWGLLDASGGATEWTEEWFFPTDPTERIVDGSPTGLGGHVDPYDRVWGLSSNRPSSAGADRGFRIATMVPSPGCPIVVVSSLLWTVARRRTP